MIEDLYAADLRNPSDMVEHMPTLVRTVEVLDAKVVIELGVYAGVSTVSWLYALEQRDGHLWSVDPEPPKRGFWSKHWTFILGDDRDPAVLAQLPEQADIVFIDTTHHYAHTREELLLYRDRVRPGGRIVLHDTAFERPFADEEPFPVRRAVAEFCEMHNLPWSHVENCYGLGMIYL